MFFLPPPLWWRSTTRPSRLAALTLFCLCAHLSVDSAFSPLLCLETRVGRYPKEGNLRISLPVPSPVKLAKKEGENPLFLSHVVPHARDAAENEKGRRQSGVSEQVAKEVKEAREEHQGKERRGRGKASVGKK